MLPSSVLDALHQKRQQSHRQEYPENDRLHFRTEQEVLVREASQFTRQVESAVANFAFGHVVIHQHLAVRQGEHAQFLGVQGVILVALVALSTLGVAVMALINHTPTVSFTGRFGSLQSSSAGHALLQVAVAKDTLVDSAGLAIPVDDSEVNIALDAHELVLDHDVLETVVDFLDLSIAFGSVPKRVLAHLALRLPAKLAELFWTSKEKTEGEKERKDSLHYTLSSNPIICFKFSVCYFSPPSKTKTT